MNMYIQYILINPLLYCFCFLSYLRIEAPLWTPLSPLSHSLWPPHSQRWNSFFWAKPKLCTINHEASWQGNGENHIINRLNPPDNTSSWTKKFLRYFGKTYYRGTGEGLLSKYTQSTPYLCARKDNCRLQESLKENEELTADKERLTVEVERLAVSNHSGGYGSVDIEKKNQGCGSGFGQKKRIWGDVPRKKIFF